jgi:hypothetical protein
MMAPRIGRMAAFLLFAGVLFGRLSGTAYGEGEYRLPIPMPRITEAMSLLYPSLADEPREKEHPRADNGGFPEWMSIAAYGDAGYRNTNFYKFGYHTIISQGDSRLEFWIPPGRNAFSWGPYVRFAGLTSDHSQARENTLLAQPCFGVQVYPFSSADLKNKNQKTAAVLGPLWLFVEHNRMDYWGSENVWRPEEHVRAGADYWKALYVNNTFIPWWTEMWSGLFWQSANEFDKDYDSWLLGNAVRLGLMKPDAGMFSTLMPYLAIESSLTENGRYFWENRLWLGAGIRFAPLLYEKADESNCLTRFIVYAKYLGAAAYYLDSAPSSVPDYDLRVGISLSVGEWYQ